VSASVNLRLHIKCRSSLLAPAHSGGPGKRAVKRLWCSCHQQGRADSKTLLQQNPPVLNCGCRLTQVSFTAVAAVNDGVSDAYDAVMCVCQLSERQHFVDNSDMYSLQDLIDLANDVLLPELTQIHASFALHIKTDCEVRLFV